jgi:hypothetical protein
MAELKIKTRTTYTYETSDGREFDLAEEAEQWQEHLENIKGITMLDSKFQYTKDHSEAFYVHIKTWQQQEAFEALQVYEGMGAHIPKPGYWYYDDCTDSYIDVDEELNRLKEIKQRLNAFGK